MARVGRSTTWCWDNIECNRSLSYAEDDVALPILTPNSTCMMFPTTNILPDLQSHHIADVDLWRRAKHLHQCMDAMWKRWSNEYLGSLRVACEGAHLFGWGAATECRREEWGEEKWACTWAIYFLIPCVRWRMQRSNWFKLTGYRNQCNLSAFHIRQTVCRL